MKLAVLACLVLAAAGCGRGTEPVKITITGASTQAPLVAQIAKRFESTHPGVRIDVQMGGSAKGIADVRNGMAQLGMIARAPKEDEKDLTVIPIVQDAICIIVHRDNPVQGLTDAQVIDIYRGRIKNWKEVGGSDTSISVIHHAEGRGTREVFLNYYKIKPEDIKAAAEIGEIEQGIKTIQGLPGALTYISIGAAEVAASRGVPIKLLGIGGVEPTAARVADGTYRATRALSFVIKGEPAGVAKEFIDFATSAQVHDLVKAENFVPIIKK